MDQEAVSKPSFVAIQLSSGIQIMTEVITQTEKEYVVSYPMEVFMRPAQGGYTTMVLQRWMPFTDNMVLLPKTAVEGLCLLTEELKKYYATQVLKTKAHEEELKQRIEEEEQEDNIEVFSKPTIKSANTTLH